MKIKKDYFNNKKIRENKRINQIKFNYSNIEEIKKLKFEEISNRYKNYEKFLENSKLLENKENNLYLLEIQEKRILLRDKIEKSFFFNKFIEIEYIDEKMKNEKLDFIEFLEKSSFLIIENEKYIILDIEKDYIEK